MKVEGKTEEEADCRTGVGRMRWVYALHSSLAPWWRVIPVAVSWGLSLHPLSLSQEPIPAQQSCWKSPCIPARSEVHAEYSSGFWEVHQNTSHQKNSSDLKSGRKSDTVKVPLGTDISVTHTVLLVVGVVLWAVWHWWVTEVCEEPI